MRIQLALNVQDLERATAHYSKLFGTPPHKQRDGYANFVIESPPLKLVLFENPNAKERLHHLGVEVLDPAELTAAQRHLEAEGLIDSVKTGETCCHATQDKIWSREHQGIRWEWYRVTDDAPEPKRDRTGVTCCTGAQRMENVG